MAGMPVQLLGRLLVPEDDLLLISSLSLIIGLDNMTTV